MPALGQGDSGRADRAAACERGSRAGPSSIACYGRELGGTVTNRKAQADPVEWLTVVLSIVAGAALVVIFVVWSPGSQATGWRQLLAALIPNVVAVLLAGPVIYVVYTRRGIAIGSGRNREIARLVVEGLKGQDLGSPSGILLAPAQLPERWTCHWTVEEPPTYPEQTVDDEISLWSLADGRVLGFGYNDVFGHYRIAGSRSKDTIALLYQGVEDRSYLLGCILIDRKADKPDSSQLKGQWFQYPAAHAYLYIWGSVRLTRVGAVPSLIGAPRIPHADETSGKRR